MFAFGVLVVMLVVMSLVLVRLRSGRVESFLPNVLKLWGSGLVAGAFLILPWVYFDEAGTYDVRVEEILGNPYFQTVLDLAPIIGELLGVQGASAAAQPPADTALRQLEVLVHSGPQLTGFQVWWSGSFAPVEFRLVLAMMMVGGLAAFLSLITILVSPTFRGSKGLAAFYGILASLALLAGLWLVPLTDSFGMRHELPLLRVLVFAGARSGPGIWPALLGLVLLLPASLLELAGQSTATDDLDLWA
jgi:hypothetical protein